MKTYQIAFKDGEPVRQPSGQEARNHGFEWVEMMAADECVGRGDELVGPLGAYIAVNLQEALRVIPDNGDWHAILRYACERTLRDGTLLQPNRTAEQMRATISGAPA